MLSLFSISSLIMNNTAVFATVRVSLIGLTQVAIYVIRELLCMSCGQPVDSGADDEDDTTAIRPIRVIHKDQESISAFCVNRCTASSITVATSKDMQELDISGLLDNVGWLDNEAEYDILNRFVLCAYVYLAILAHFFYPAEDSILAISICLVVSMEERKSYYGIVNS